MHPLAGLNVFISYPRGGHAHTWAERVVAELRAAQAQPFRDEAAIPEGDTDWLQRLKEGLLKSDVLVCILVHGSEVCRWQHRELLRADQLHLPVVAFRVGAVEVPFVIANCQPAEFVAGQPDASLKRLLGAVAAAAPERPAPPRPLPPMLRPT